MNEEILAKARGAGSPEELLKIAKENGMTDFTEENAKAYFEAMHKSGEISDDELENAVGGCKTSDGRRVVTKGMLCTVTDKIYGWECNVCHEDMLSCTCNRTTSNFWNRDLGVTGNFNKLGVCGCCAHCSYEGGKWLCNDPIANSK